jgi:hypothetical protein
MPDVVGEYTYVVITDNTVVKITGIWFTGYRENIQQTFLNQLQGTRGISGTPQFRK